MDKLQQTKVNVLEYLKSKGWYYNSVNILNTKDGSNEPIEIYVNNYRILSCSIFRIISIEEIELFLQSDFWNYPADDKRKYFIYNPFMKMKM